MSARGTVAAVVFDIGRVLVGVDVARAVRHLGRITGAPPAEVEFALFGPHHRSLSRGEIDGPRFHAAVRAALGRDVPFADFVTAWCDMFDPVPPMGPLVSTVARERPVFLCSNTDPLHYEHLRATQPVLSFARGATLSYEVGSEKPEAGIFEALLRDFDLDPATTVFIDDRAENVAAATRLGITGVVFEGADSLRADLRELGIRSL